MAFYGAGRRRGTPANYIQNRGFTGHDRTQADDALGVVYMNARVYMPSTGKFLTPDTLVPDPANSQSYNRYTYVHNNPINLTDPSGHAAPREMCLANPYHPLCEATSSTPVPTTPTVTPNPSPSPTPSGARVPSPFPKLKRLPLDDVKWAQGFGANSFAESNHTEYYQATSGLHGGIDLGGDPGDPVYSATDGVIVGINTGDGNPNIVVKVGDNAYIVYRHTKITTEMEDCFYSQQECRIKVGDQIGTLDDQGGNTHLHLVMYRCTDGGATHACASKRVYNPLYFIDPSLVEELDWGGYPEGEGLYSMYSFLYSATNFWDHPDSPLIGVERR